MDKESNLFTLQFLLPPSQEDRLRDWIQLHRYATWPNWGGHITLVNIFKLRDSAEQLVEVIGKKSRDTEPFKIFFNRLVMERHRVHQGLYTVYLTHSSDAVHEQDRLREFHDEIINLLQPIVSFRQKELETINYRQHLSLTWGLPKKHALELYEQARNWKLELWCELDSLSLLKVFPLEKKRWEMKIYREFSLNNQLP